MVRTSARSRSLYATILQDEDDEDEDEEDEEGGDGNDEGDNELFDDKAVERENRRLDAERRKAEEERLEDEVRAARAGDACGGLNIRSSYGVMLSTFNILCVGTQAL
mmetsp:Transcript_11126/g.30854  ORF Transcript_11126/g.30854 Transcript_11126/m.30854 type:complete len:107 (+) Transcript_11126:648-968(+)